MIIDLSKTKDSIGQSFALEVSENLTELAFGGTVYSFVEPVQVTGNYYMGDAAITMTAILKTAVTVPCARCLVKTKVALDIPIEENFSRIESDDAYLFSGYIVDLTQAMLDNIALNLPLHSLCKEDCKGLCPHCGTDLNKDKCDCEVEHKKAYGPFAVLNGLLSEDKEEV